MWRGLHSAVEPHRTLGSKRGESLHQYLSPNRDGGPRRCTPSSVCGCPSEVDWRPSKTLRPQRSHVRAMRGNGERALSPIGRFSESLRWGLHAAEGERWFPPERNNG